MKFQHQPRGIIHIGAGALEEAEYYNSLCGSHVIWVEARGLSQFHHKTADRFGHKLFQQALSDTAGVVDFHHTDNGVSSSLLKLKEHPGVSHSGTEKVQTLRADEFFNDSIAQYDTLVLDVQGAELAVLRGFWKLLNGFDWIVSEVFYAELYKDVPMADEVKAFLTGMGFELVAEEKDESELWGDMMFKRL